MLRETALEWTREWLREGEAKMLVWQLENKLGLLREEVQQRVSAADADQLLDWGKRILTADSLSEIFGN